MAAPGNGPGRFHLTVSPALADRIKRLHADARDRGSGEAFRTAFGRLMEQIQSSALTYGEPRYPLRQLGLVVRVVAQSPLVVQFAVSAHLRQAWITQVDLMG